MWYIIKWLLLFNMDLRLMLFASRRPDGMGAAALFLVLRAGLKSLCYPSGDLTAIPPGEDGMYKLTCEVLPHTHRNPPVCSMSGPRQEGYFWM